MSSLGDDAKPRAIGGIYDQKFVDDPSDLYLSAAVLAVLRLTSTAELRDPHAQIRCREEVATACVLAFLSLEACINRLFFDTFEDEESGRCPLPSAPATVVSYVHRAWNRMAVRDKWLVLPPLVSAYSLDPATPPFNLFEEFICFRNRLVHPKATGSTFKVRATRVEASSWGGEVLEHMSDIPPSEELFPLTKFSTSFMGLQLSDAEKSVEISYRMRMALANGLHWNPPFLVYDEGSGFKAEVGSSVGRLLASRATIHFGPLPE
jgi:hypothetical protein